MSEKTATLEQAVEFFGSKLAAVELPEGWTVGVETALCDGCGGGKVLALFTNVMRDRSVKVRVTHCDNEEGEFTQLEADWSTFSEEILPIIVQNLDEIEDGDHVDTTIRGRTTVHVVLVTASGSLEEIIADFLAQMEQEEQDDE